MKITKQRFKEIIEEELAQVGILQMLGMKDKSVEQDLDHIEKRLNDFIRGAYDESLDEKEQYEILKRLFKELQPLQRSGGPGNKKQMERLKEIIKEELAAGLADNDSGPGLEESFEEIYNYLEEFIGNSREPLTTIQMIEDAVNNMKIDYTPDRDPGFYADNPAVYEEKKDEKRGTEGVCTGDKFGSDECPPGSKRYNLAKTFRKMAKKKKK